MLAASDSNEKLHKNEKYTPTPWVNFARDVFGQGIELDPASCAEANRVVQAERYYSLQSGGSGLLECWQCDTLWLNPPYSAVEVSLFANKLLTELHHIDQAMVLVNACTETRWFQAMLKDCDAALFPSRRIQFWKPGETETDRPKGRNEYRQCIMYWGRNVDLFSTLGNKIGVVVSTCNN